MIKLQEFIQFTFIIKTLYELNGKSVIEYVQAI